MAVAKIRRGENETGDRRVGGGGGEKDAFDATGADSRGGVNIQLYVK